MSIGSIVSGASRRLFICLAGLGVLGAQPGRYIASTEPAGGTGSPTVVVIRDNTAGVEAAVAPSEGGELSSLRVKFQGKWVELVYRARDYGPGSGFRGKASFLWPAVGGQYPVGSNPASACADGTYQVGGRSYPMPCHGFAKTLAWEEAGHSADGQGARVSVELRDSDRTRGNYPFGFRVRATYEISGGRLTITYRVSAATNNSGPMPFSIGNHIAFRLPFLQGTDPAAMLFETPSRTQMLRDSRGLLNGEERPRSFSPATPVGSFDSTVALPMAGYQGTAFARLTDPQGLSLRISHRPSAPLPEPLVQFNVFGGPRQGFLCPEPWFGIQNSLNLKKGLVTLPAGGEWRWTVELSPEATAETRSDAAQAVEKKAADWPSSRVLYGRAAVHRDHSRLPDNGSFQY